MHQFYADCAYIVPLGVVSGSIFGCTGSDISRAIDDVMNAKNGIPVKKLLPARCIPRRPRMNNMAVNTQWTADRVYNDSVDFCPQWAGRCGAALREAGNLRTKRRCYVPRESPSNLHKLGSH